MRLEAAAAEEGPKSPQARAPLPCPPLSPSFWRSSRAAAGEANAAIAANAAPEVESLRSVSIFVSQRAGQCWGRPRVWTNTRPRTIGSAWPCRGTRSRPPSPGVAHLSRTARPAPSLAPPPTHAVAHACFCAPSLILMLIFSILMATHTRRLPRAFPEWQSLVQLKKKKLIKMRVLLMWSCGKLGHRRTNEHSGALEYDVKKRRQPKERGSVWMEASPCRGTTLRRSAPRATLLPNFATVCRGRRSRRSESTSSLLLLSSTCRAKR